MGNFYKIFIIFYKNNYFFYFSDSFHDSRSERNYDGFANSLESCGICDFYRYFDFSSDFYQFFYL